MIMQAKTRRTLSRSGRGLVLGLAALALPLLPVQGQGTGELHEQQLHLTQLHEHLTMLDRSQEQGTHAHNSKEILAALHEAIDALRDRDQDDEAAILVTLARTMMGDIENHARTLTDRNRVIVDLEHERQALVDERHAIELDRAGEQRHIVQMDLVRRAWQDVEMAKRDEATRSIRDDLLHRMLTQGQSGTDQIRRLEARIDKLADMVKELAEMAKMAKKQQAEQNRRRIR